MEKLAKKLRFLARAFLQAYGFPLGRQRVESPREGGVLIFIS